MKSALLFLFTNCLLYSITNAQSLPPQTCGVVYSYDAAGNRTQRAYVCNNSVGRYTYTPLKAVGDSTDLNVDILASQANTTLPPILQIYPNPTTGRFTVSFSQPLDKAKVTLLDFAGHVLQQSIKSGNQLIYDLSSYAAGTYVLQVIDGASSFSFKVIKQ